MMSYYAGDYYAGDPGFLSLIGRGIGALTGLGGLFHRRPAPPMNGAGGLGGLIRRAGPAVRGMLPPVISGAGAAGIERLLTPKVAPGGLMPGMGLRGPAGPVPGGGMKGYHMSKPRRGIPSHLVRNRHMRVTNPRALRRAIRRANGFARLAKKVLHFTSPKAPKGRAVFKRKRKRT